MTMETSVPTQKKPFESIEDFASGLIEFVTGSESPDPEVGKIVAKHILPINKHPDAVKRAQKELIDLVEGKEGA